MAQKIELTLTAIVTALFGIPMFIVGLPTYCFAKHFLRVATNERNIEEDQVQSAMFLLCMTPIKILKAIWTTKD